MADPLGVAVIGAGMAGRAHAQAYRNASTVLGPETAPIRLVAIADVNGDFARGTAARYGFERAETSWQALVEAPDIHAVSIAVANHLHREIAEALLSAGKHVLCEKPLSTGAVDAEAMVAAAAAADRVACCGFSYRRSPAISAIVDQIHSGALGELLHFNGRFWCDYAADPDAPATWRYGGPLGSGALADLGSHVIDLSEQLCGPIASVRGASLPILITDRPVPLSASFGHTTGEVVSDERRPVTNEDIATFVVNFRSGAVGTFSISRVALGYPNELAFDLTGSKAAARFDLSTMAQFGYVDLGPAAVTNGWRRVIVGPDHPYVADALAMPFPGLGHGAQEFFTAQARAFLDEVQGINGFPRQATFADGLRSIRVEEAVVASARSGRAIEVPG